jgi:hypothetical protein
MWEMTRQVEYSERSRRRRSKRDYGWSDYWRMAEIRAEPWKAS